MEEIFELPQPVQPSASVPEMTLESMEAQIRQAQGETPIQAQPVVQVAPATQGQPVPTIEGQPQGQTPPIVAKSGESLTFEELQAKTGVKSPEDLAKSIVALKTKDELAQEYIQLRRDAEKNLQEAARLRKQEPYNQQPPIQTPPQAQPPTTGQANYDEMFAQRVSQVGVVQAMAEIMKAVASTEMKPYSERNAEIELKNKVAELETSPATASTFANPEVQVEIKKVISENPDYYYKNLTSTLPEAYERALGRLAIKGVASKPSQNQSTATFMEGKTKPIMPQPINANSTDVGEMEKYLKSLMG